ncbi:CbiX/SirB N-terminal domain-containing protein [Ammonicoccus fulvus]|uniref:CbiX/SirB N-terminal domain-containing protein n=1 Tax=Ammonicoccus fulvus TaxID=3138240 RepID=A0ABZ3FP45_9ACTN
MTRILAAHGTRDAVGQATVRAIADAVEARVGPVRLAWLDHLEPTLPDVMADLPETDGPACIVPLLLSEGFHIHTDIPEVLTGLDGAAVRVTPPLGSDPRIVDALADRLAEAGWRGEPVVLAATGSARASWHRLAGEVAAGLGDRLGVPVDLGVLSGPGIPVSEQLSRTRENVSIAAYLLAEGHFHRRLVQSGAAVVAAPIGAHPALVDLLVSRFSDSC